jgi:hypothetical protein
MQSFALDAPTALYYAAGEGLTPLMNALAMSNAVNSGDKDAIMSLFRLLNSGSISTMSLDNGSVLYRFVITLPG